MDVKSYIKSASLQELEELQGFLSNEMKRRKTRPSKIRKIRIFTDGAARGNPGPAGIGALIFDEADEKILQDFQYIGETTNNEAEYRALLLALDRATDLNPTDVDCFMDSELLVRQLNGEYSLRSEKLKQFYDEVRKRIERFDSVKFTHLRREHPKIQMADKLANKAIDEARPNKNIGV